MWPSFHLILGDLEDMEVLLGKRRRKGVVTRWWSKHPAAIFRSLLLLFYPGEKRAKPIRSVMLV